MLPILLLAFLCLPLTAADRGEDIGRLIQDYHEAGRFNGSALVAESGKVILSKGYGLANREFGIPCESDTKYRLASITKQFTALLVLQLVEQKKLSLDGTVSQYLPEYPKKQGDRVTIDNLLNHTSGIPSYTGFPGFFQDRSRDPFTPLELTRLFWDKDLEFEPGTKYRYNNSGYHLLGVILEKVAGMPYEKLVAERIFGPLGMRNSGYDHNQEILPKRAAGYQVALDGFRNADYIDMSIPFSAGSLYSTTEDLRLWDEALYANRLLSLQSRDRMFRPGLSDYGYGWIIQRKVLPGSSEQILLVSHGGGIPGFATLITRVPEQRHFIVLLSNTPGAAQLGGIQDGILAILFGRQPQPAKRSIASAVYAALKTGGAAQATQAYRKLKAEDAARYDFSEGELNQLGYALIEEAGRVKDSIEIFKLNVEAFPKSSNAHDSLGEAYARDGQKEAAIRSYEKALELNPKNSNAAKRLQALRGGK